MRPSIRRIDSYTQPVSGSIAFDVLTFVKSELLARQPSLADDPVFEVSSEPRGTYTGVRVYVEKENIDLVIGLAEEIEDQLEVQGYRTLIAVRAWKS